MSCHAWQHLLQQHLDGEGEGAALEQHLRSCSDCAAERPALQRLLAGMALLAAVSAPPGLAERITGRLCAEARVQRRQRLRRRVVSLVGFAAAAAVLLAVGIRAAWRDSGTGIPKSNPETIVKKSNPPDAPATLLRDSVVEAGTALAGLTSRTASATVDQTASLLPDLPAPVIEPLASLETPMEPLREASAGVSAGLAPVADSARRAVSLFFRDMPVGRGDQPETPGKPG